MSTETVSIRAVLVRETEKARLFRVSVGNEVWVPRSVVKAITKFAPDAKGERECLVDVEEWFHDRNL